jgi:hypothetical protein
VAFGQTDDYSIGYQFNILSTAGALAYNLAKVFWFENNAKGKAIKELMKKSAGLEAELKNALNEYNNQMKQYKKNGLLETGNKSSLKISEDMAPKSYAPETIKSKKALKEYNLMSQTFMFFELSGIGKQLDEQSKWLNLMRKIDPEYKLNQEENNYLNTLFEKQDKLSEIGNSINEVQDKAKEYLPVLNQLNKLSDSVNELLDDFADYVSGLVVDKYNALALGEDMAKSLKSEIKQDNLFLNAKDISQAREIALKAGSNNQKGPFGRIMP